MSSWITPALSQPILPHLHLRSILGGFLICKWEFSQQGSGHLQPKPQIPANNRGKSKKEEIHEQDEATEDGDKKFWALFEDPGFSSACVGLPA